MAIRKMNEAQESAPSGYFKTEELIKAYENMLLIRRFEERSAQLYGMGLIAGFCHLYSGQEAVVVGLQACANPQDTVITSYRDHGHMLACGMEAKGVMAELLGRATGYSKGKGGSMHMFSREKNFFGGHGVVGAQVPIGTGLAFAHKYNDDAGLCWAYLGDGAINQGQVYEAFNMAALWKLPVIYVVEDNAYSMGTSVARASASPHFYKRGEPYGIPGREIDGMDLMAVRDAGEWAADHARKGEGPVLLHMKTYRYRGHSMSDPAKYRTRDEVEQVRNERDPIERLKHHLLGAAMIDEEGLLAIDKRVKEEVAEAVTFSQNSPEPDAAELYTDIIIEID